MDDETAEIELLEQNLNKTRQISQRMTSKFHAFYRRQTLNQTAILNSFDTRLAKLEKSILPLYTSTQILNRRASNIEKALLKIDELASNQEGIAVEEALILRGPQPSQLDAYRDALERLNAAIAFKGSEGDSLETARLVETGAKKLTQLYTKLVAEGSSGSMPPPGSDLPINPFPPSLLETLVPLVAFLRTLPLPSTHPSHPASPAILSTLKEAQRGYADMRGAWCRKCLEGQGRRVLDRADTIDPIAAGLEFGKWAESILDVAEEEFSLLEDLSPLSNPQLAYGALMNPILVLFSSTLNSLIGSIKRSLHKYNFLALSSYEYMLSLQSRWDKTMARRGTDARKETNEFRDGLQSLRNVCLRSFPEFLADVKMASMGKGGELGTTLADFVVSTVKYLDRIPEVQSAAGAALVTLGDGNWKMGEGVQVGKASKLGEGDEHVILEHYVYDVVNTTINSLNVLSRTQKRAVLSSIFILNNIAFLRRNVLLDPKHDALLDMLSKPTQDVINSNFRMAKAAYFDSNFSPLIQALSEDSKEKGKAATKERFTRFYDLFDEIIERHRGVVSVLEDDEEGRAEIGEEVVKLIVPSLERFVAKHREKEFSKNPQKYIRLSVEDVEAQLRSIYR
ncbi:uncharacterized protein ARMOST_21220 [Armillaria ostoyae]|uniref:Exocyst complex protein EXO70 n=1 Tax=Armillaria ostoyae TaxID=47428 RepID=A0A284S9H7_ARMOS|nr:uncharacterized protein ARMOST_21220 [Armillaria ostoyae]